MAESPLLDPRTNRGTAFDSADRQRLGLDGLLPPAVETIDQQLERVLDNVRRLSSDLDRYVYLHALQERNETLYYRALQQHLPEMLPIVYTPTVGAACQAFDRIFQSPRGLYICCRDRGRVRELLRHWPRGPVRVIVVTDGTRILGLGDLGSNGMGIPIGKLDLYTACGGISPEQCLPVMLDTGTDNTGLRESPFYLGLREPRLQGTAYDELLEEFVVATQQVFPEALLQFEDFSNRNAFALLDRYRNRTCCFNDDIQGTGAMGLAGLYSAMRITGQPLTSLRLLFAGAGEAALGMAQMVTSALEAQGLDPAEARRACWLMDSQGLVAGHRTGLPAHKQAYAHQHPPVSGLAQAVEQLRPNVLIGASGVHGLFTAPVLQALARCTDRPLVMALSNPTSRAECTAQQAYEWTQGKALFASGSPSAPVTWADRTLMPGQANNAYIFPGVGLGVLASAASRVTDAMFFAAAGALAQQVTADDLACGRIFPGQERLSEVALAVAIAVAEVAYDQGLARHSRPDDLHQSINALRYQANYR